MRELWIISLIVLRLCRHCVRRQSRSLGPGTKQCIRIMEGLIIVNTQNIYEEQVGNKLGKIKQK